MIPTIVLSFLGIKQLIIPLCFLGNCGCKLSRSVNSDIGKIWDKKESYGREITSFDLGFDYCAKMWRKDPNIMEERSLH